MLVSCHFSSFTFISYYAGQLWYSHVGLTDSIYRVSPTFRHPGHTLLPLCGITLLSTNSKLFNNDEHAWIDGLDNCIAVHLLRAFKASHRISELAGNDRNGEWREEFCAYRRSNCYLGCCWNVATRFGLRFRVRRFYWLATNSIKRTGFGYQISVGLLRWSEFKFNGGWIVPHHLFAILAL